MADGAYVSPAERSTLSTSSNPVLRAIHSFSPAAMRPFARRNYRFELLAACSWPIAVTMIEGAVTGLIAKKAFSNTPGWVLATLTAAPVVSNVTSSIWTGLANGRLTVRSLNVLQLAVLFFLLVIAFIPINTLGLYAFMAAVVAARVLMAGVITLRSVLWRANYPREDRARITGKLITIQTSIVAVVGYGLGKCMDWNESSFRVLYPAAIGCALIGVWAFSRIRVRRPFLMKSEREHERTGETHEALPPIALLAIWGATISAMARVLREDFAFRGYMVCMFVMGISNLAVQAPLIQMVTDQFKMQYATSIVVLQSIPFILIPLTIPLWARYFDRVHVIRFRSLHSWVFVFAHLLTFLAGYLGSVTLLIAAQVARGIGFGGGALAWNIGHNDFSSHRDAGLYMTVHVTLTGIRGLIGAYTGIILYSGLVIGSFRLAPLEEYSFLFWGAVGTTGALGFVYLNYRMSHLTRERPSPD